MKKNFIINKKKKIFEFIKKKNILKRNIYNKIRLQLNSFEDIKDFLKKKKINIFCKSKKKKIIVSIIGHSNNGKTTIIKELSKDYFFEKEYNNITQNSNAYNSKNNYGKFILIDTPGHDEFDDVKKKAIIISDISMVVLEACKEIEKNTLLMLNYLITKKKKFFFVINKIDINIDKKEISKNSILLFLKNSNINSVETFKISAKRKIGLDFIKNFIKNINFNVKKKNYIISSKYYKGEIITKILLKSNNIFIGKKIYNDKNKLICIVKKIFFKKKILDVSFPVSLVEVIGFYKKHSFGEKIFFKKNILKINKKKKKYYVNSNFLDPVKKSIYIISDISDYIDILKKIIISSRYKDKYKLVGEKLINKEFNDIFIENCEYLYYGKLILKNKNIKDFYTIYDVLNFLNNKKTKEKKFKNIIIIRKNYKIKKKKVFGVFVKKGSIFIEKKYSLIRNKKVINKCITLSSLKIFDSKKKIVTEGNECGVIFKNYTNLLIGDLLCN
ncbi:GTP-binding protein [Candidatus Vidania fulgoroideorum]